MLFHRENDNQISPPSASWCCKRLQDVLSSCGSINCSLGGCDIYQHVEERHGGPPSSAGRDDPTFAQCLGVASNNRQQTSCRPIENRFLGVVMPMEHEVIHYLRRTIKDPFLSHSSTDYSVLLVFHIELQTPLVFPSCLSLVVKTTLAFCMMRQGLLIVSW